MLGAAGASAAAAARGRLRLDRRPALVVALALAAPVGEALVSAVGSNLLGSPQPGGVVAGVALVRRRARRGRGPAARRSPPPR